MTATPTTILPVAPEGIPGELVERRQWVLWRLVTRDGKPTKLPYQTTGALAKSDDPSTWTTFDAALVAYQRGGYSGIGYVFGADDPYVGIDLDDCIDVDTGAPSAWAAEIIKRLGTYAETSPSGTGIKLWARGKLPTEATGRKRPYETGAVEMYQRGRYFAVTGQQLPHWTAPIADSQDGIGWLWATALADKPHERNGHQHAAHDGNVRRILERARKYVATMDIAIDGQYGSDDAMDAACVLVLGFGLTPEQAYPLFCDYSERCQPPWSEKEIWHKLRSADKKPGERGYLRDARRNDDRHTSNGKASSSAATQTPAERIEYQLLTCRELDAAEYDLEYLIDHMLVARQPCISRAARSA